MGKKLLKKVVGFSFVVFFLTFITLPYLKDSDAYIGEVRGIFTDAIENLPIGGLDSVDKDGILESASRITQNIPRNINDLMHSYVTVSEMISDIEQSAANVETEVLRLNSPKQLSVGEFMVGKEVKNILSDKDVFEVVDTREGGLGWELTIGLTDLLGEQGNISYSSGELILRDRIPGMTVVEGNPLVVRYLGDSESYTTHVIIRPEIVLYIDREVYIGKYKGTISSNLAAY